METLICDYLNFNYYIKGDVCYDKNHKLVFYRIFIYQLDKVFNLPKKELELCDAVVEIPMVGEKESLNVSVSAGIILFSCN